MNKTRAIVKRPDEEIGHVTNISPTLKNLQNIVDGPIEVVTLVRGVVVICNEEGRINDLPWNCRVTVGNLSVDFCGEIVVLGSDGEEFTDLPEWVTRKQWRAWIK